MSAIERGPRDPADNLTHIERINPVPDGHSNADAFLHGATAAYDRVVKVIEEYLKPPSSDVAALPQPEPVKALPAPEPAATKARSAQEADESTG